ncbi:hypothetical protein L1987_55913 [Smallanthus sonchifolius]|uniref:Uncharacterized protein n=1 Tax=Smallanthus sonchifolius TaxID=185202 RepID=A0ACB9EBN6_9ASTR|nr:hypothetical protein L1987_55913 [Smallanthus sonchifolius]
MDTGNRRSTQGAICGIDDSTIESGDWRTQLQRQRVVNKIVDTLKKHLPFTGYERLQELKKIAERVEQEIYTAATSQSEYSRMICFMMLTMETRLQNPLRSNSAVLYNSVNPSVPFDLTAQTGNPNGGDWQSEVYQKIKAMKELYLLDSWPTQGSSSAVGDLTMESGDWRARLQSGSRERIKSKILDTLKRHLPFSGHEGLQELKKIAARFEDKIYSTATSQSDYLRKISLKMLVMENR